MLDVRWVGWTRVFVPFLEYAVFTTRDFIPLFRRRDGRRLVRGRRVVDLNVRARRRAGPRALPRQVLQFAQVEIAHLAVQTEVWLVGLFLEHEEPTRIVV